MACGNVERIKFTNKNCNRSKSFCLAVEISWDHTYPAIYEEGYCPLPDKKGRTDAIKKMAVDLHDSAALRMIVGAMVMSRKQRHDYRFQGRRQ
jgi:hypothetical protein